MNELTTYESKDITRLRVVHIRLLKQDLYHLYLQRSCATTAVLQGHAPRASSISCTSSCSRYIVHDIGADAKKALQPRSSRSNAPPYASIRRNMAHYNTSKIV